MTKPIARDPIYRGRRFQSEIIELCVRWYLTYRLSYRDLVAMMAERGVTLSHTTIFRWVQRYVPEFERRWSRYAKPVHSSWRMDETTIPVRGGPLYLYRAVDGTNTGSGGKCTQVVLGAYPEVCLESAKSRHEFARNLLAKGTNPSALKATLGKHAFVLKIQEWETARGYLSGHLPCLPEAIGVFGR